MTLLALVATYVALVLGRHGRWLAIELRAWALAYPLFLMAVVRPITSMWRFLLLDFPIAALVASVAMRTSTGASVVPHWRRRVAVVVAPVVAVLRERAAGAAAVQLRADALGRVARLLRAAPDLRVNGVHGAALLATHRTEALLARAAHRSAAAAGVSTAVVVVSSVTGVSTE